MGKVVGLFDRQDWTPPPDEERPAPDAGTVEWAESLLEKAKSGQIDGFVVVANCRDNSIIHMHVGNVRRVAVIGGLAHMEHFLNAEIKQQW
jgi:repressor of nif and glnA expression